MKEKRRLEVHVETHEITKISFKQNYSTNAFCRSCQSETVHLTVSEAALILNFSDSAIFRLAEARQIHSVETGSGLLLICGNSLTASAQG